MSAVLCSCWNAANVPYLLHFLRRFWFYAILNMQKAKVFGCFGGTSQIHVYACQEFYLTIKQEVTLTWLYFSKRNAIYYHFSLGYKIFLVGGKNTHFCEYTSRLSSFTLYHAVILFCSNSIKLIVFLGNYPQPPAGQISIHDLNNAY